MGMSDFNSEMKKLKDSQLRLSQASKRANLGNNSIGFVQIGDLAYIEIVGSDQNKRVMLTEEEGIRFKKWLEDNL